MEENKLTQILGYGRDFAHGASNGIASNVSAPVDLLAIALRKTGIPIPDDPVMGTRWMMERGLMQTPQNHLAGQFGESAGLAGSAMMATKLQNILMEHLRRRVGDLSTGLLGE